MLKRYCWGDLGLFIALCVIALGSYLLWCTYKSLDEPLAIRLINFDGDGEEKIKAALAKLNPPVKRRISMVVEVEQIGKGNCGQCLREGSGQAFVLLINRDNIGSSTIYHEAGHARFWMLPKSAVDEWLELSGNPVYIDEEWRKENNFDYPRQGILTRYGRHSANEDIAIWTEAVYAELDGETTRLRSLDKTDPIYRRRLDWLLKWEFINSDQHSTIISLIFQ